MNEHEEEQYFEVPDIERLINIPIVNPDEPFVEILTELKGLRKDNKPVETQVQQKEKETKLNQKDLIAEYVSFRDRKKDTDWGVIIHRRAFWNLVSDAFFETDYTVQQVEKHLRQYFVQRETFHFYVDRAIYALENSFNLHFHAKHDLWKHQCGKRPYKYPQPESDAAENFSWKMKSPGAEQAFAFLKKSLHIHADSMKEQTKYGTHRELHSLVLSQYLKSGCQLNDRIVGIETLLSLGDDGKGGITSIKLSETDKRAAPLRLPFRVY